MAWAGQGDRNHSPSPELFEVFLFLCGPAGTLNSVYMGPEAGLLFNVSLCGLSWLFLNFSLLDGLCLVFGVAFISVALWSLKMESHKPLIGADHFLPANP